MKDGNYKNVSAIILSGGLSTRMGQDKCELVYNGKTFLQHQIDKVRNIGIEDIVLSGYRGTSVNEKIIKDEMMLGPLSGIYLGLNAIENDRAYVTSVDTIFVHEDVIKKLIDESFATDENILVITHHSKTEPLIAIYKKAIVEKIKDKLDKKDLKVLNLLSEVGCKYVEIDDDDEFMNINYKDEYNRLTESL